MKYSRWFFHLGDDIVILRTYIEKVVRNVGNELHYTARNHQTLNDFTHFAEYLEKY